MMRARCRLPYRRGVTAESDAPVVAAVGEANRQWVDAYVAGDTELADFYRQRFRDEFKPAFDAWIATEPRTNTDAPHTPVEMPRHKVAEAQRAERQNVTAAASSARAANAIERSDHYMLAVVLFASALFFAGISTKFQSIRRREVLVVIGWAIFLGAASWVLVLVGEDVL